MLDSLNPFLTIPNSPDSVLQCTVNSLPISPVVIGLLENVQYKILSLRFAFGDWHIVKDNGISYLLAVAYQVTELSLNIAYYKTSQTIRGSKLWCLCSCWYG